MMKEVWRKYTRSPNAMENISPGQLNPPRLKKKHLLPIGKDEIVLQRK